MPLESFNLSDKKILLVEDDISICMMIEDSLLDVGCRVVGPAHTLDDAVGLAREAEIDIALIDVNLRHVEAYPVANILAARTIPFILMTGYGLSDIQDAYQDRPVLLKPFVVSDALSMLAKVYGSV